FQDSINGKFDTLTKNTQESMTNNLTKFMETLSLRLDALTKTTQDTLNHQQQIVQTSLKSMQDSNEKKLEEMRVTVDEKLQSTLEKRLTGSFQVVQKQLEAVQKGLGEMQNLASDVGGLKRALTNVKTAGGMGEVQLEALLAQMLSPEQFVKNAHPNPNNSKKIVEFAVKIPSKTADEEYVLLPIDSKYPAAVWDKLSLAYENADKDEIEIQKKALVSDIKKMAKDIKEKYIEAPYTTDFGLLFLPFEGLFAEVMRIPGLFQQIQDDFKVTIAGPTTLGAFLNSLQMGFRTLAIQKETSKVWDLLGSVKTEFGKFGDVLAKTKKKLAEASNTIDAAEVRSRAIERHLSKVEMLPQNEAETNSQSLLDNLTDED
ncbi:MAG: DNA recombination protein RmuC, partial [Treponemataceae bacterium]|nr:DNA recombination protein RmuC [Treponemataceae bacterium]